jgi:HAD superfamily hydrolase (TIGR01509 family)
MDGLMTDTEQLFLDLWCQVLREQGQPEYRDVVAHCIGLNHQATHTYIRETLGEDFDYMSILRQVGIRSKAYCEANGVPVKPGLYTLLDYLDENNIPYAVATSTASDNAQWRLENIGVLSRLKALITGDMVSHGKPAPEIFEKAAVALGLPPEECMVLEDSPHGILAAHRAGCLPVMVPDLRQPDSETAKLLYAQVERLDQVIGLLR